ncbi:hypothetical protein NDU88_002358 [Pleurodeles waltl]|uniref:Uncharacterized protein n=1 Tax=Pleurodeles waltl TaxID=8319 RepID=A0AAV7RAQ7_PLEWA|nr:hypothetical protein NDU88_002358 [Pleurodeles waltl]
MIALLGASTGKTKSEDDRTETDTPDGRSPNKSENEGNSDRRGADKGEKEHHGLKTETEGTKLEEQDDHFVTIESSGPR